MRLEVCIYRVKYNISLYYAEPKLGVKRFTSLLQPFDIEFQPFIEDINAKEGVIRECADAATMERIRGIILDQVFGARRKRLTQIYRHRKCPSGYYVRFSQVEWLVNISSYFIVLYHKTWV